MQRRHASLALLLLAPLRPATAALSEGDASAGVRAALERGAGLAVARLGRPDGFFADPRLRIPLPGPLEQASKVLKLTGQQQRVDELVLAMNRAAEAAVPQAKPLLVNAVKSMSVEDALAIVRGGEDSVTRFFAGKTREPLFTQLLPVVTRATEKVALAQRYNALAERLARSGLVRQDDVNLERHVTGKTLDGLYLAIGEEERRIRQDPVGTGSAILRKVFGG
jgi:hypothetical protein